MSTSCSDALVFDTETQILHCESCGNEFPFDTLSELSGSDEGASKPSRYDWASYEEIRIVYASGESIYASDNQDGFVPYEALCEIHELFCRRKA